MRRDRFRRGSPVRALVVGILLWAVASGFHWVSTGNVRLNPLGRKAWGRGLRKTKPRLPAEFERQETLLVSWDRWLAEGCTTLADIVEAAHGRVPVIALASGGENRRLALRAVEQRRLPSTCIQFWDIPHDTAWIRDYGPLFIARPDGVGIVVDAASGPDYRSLDEQVPSAIARLIGSPVRPIPLAVEGGNLLSNGQGLCLATSRLLAENRKRGFSENGLRNGMRRYFGCDNLVLLEPLSGERTGHVDMFATFTSPRTVVVGEYDRGDDPINARILDRNAERLAQTGTRMGKLEVVRVPMPPHDELVWRTYTNGVFANGALLVPVYPDVAAKTDESAVAIFRRLLPSWEIVPVDASKVVRHGGALHCITMNVPALKRYPSPAATATSPRRAAKKPARGNRQLG